MNAKQKAKIKDVLLLLASSGIGFFSSCKKGFFEFKDPDDILKYLNNPTAYINKLESNGKSIF